MTDEPEDQELFNAFARRLDGMSQDYGWPLLDELLDVMDDSASYDGSQFTVWQRIHDIAARHGLSSETVTRLGHHGI